MLYHTGGTMESVNGFPVSELAARTGVPVPTIHAYYRRGLLPAPIRLSGNRFLYDRRHVAALGLIRVLRDRRHLPLGAIKDMLPTLLGGDDQEHAFRPEMWDDVLRAYLPEEGAVSTEAKLVATARTIFCRQGYADTAIDDICLAAGVAKGTFYRHFASKDDVYLAAAAGVADAVGDLPAGDGEALATALAPFAPLLLEVASRAVRGEPGHAEVLAGLAARLEGDAGRDAVDAAVWRVVREGLSGGVRPTTEQVG